MTRSDGSQRAKLWSQARPGGIGSTTCRYLASLGATIVVADRDATVEKTRDDIRAAGGTAQAVIFNVTDKASVEAAAARLPSASVL